MLFKCGRVHEVEQRQESILVLERFMDDIHVSVMICTRNRADRLLECLKSFEKIVTSLRWELVVVDNSSVDHTRAVLEEFAVNTHLNVVIGEEQKKGSGNAKNKGIELSRGTFIAFTDDDCYPETDYIDAIYRLLCSDERLGFVGGRVLLFDPLDLPVTIQTYNERIYLNPGDFLHAGIIHGANFAFRRTALIQAGMFDGRFGAGTIFSCEDVDLMAELLRLGWKGQYDPSILVYHHHRRRTQAEVDTLFVGYDWGRGAYLAKHILKPGHRLLFAKRWFNNIRWQPARTSWRELQGALAFWWLALTR